MKMVLYNNPIHPWAFGLCAIMCGLMSLSIQAELVLLDADDTYPSGGSGAPKVLSGGGRVLVNADMTQTAGASAKNIPDDPDAPGTPAASLTFTGVTQAPSIDGGFTYKPPDTHGAVGPGAGSVGRIVQVTNSGIEIFNKSGTTVASQTDLDAFMTTLGLSGLSGSGSGNLGFDPKVIYDQNSGRFFIVILDGRTPSGGGARSNVVICTSKDATPDTLTTTDWSAESDTALVTIDSSDTWFDYPGIGADSTRLIVTGNMFTSGGTFKGNTIRVFLKASLTDDGSPSGATFTDIIIDSAVTPGTSTIQPAHVFGSTLNGDFYMVNRFGSTAYQLWQITGIGGSTAALVSSSPSTHGSLTLGSALDGAAQTTNGTNDEPTISTLSARMMNAMYRSDSIWWCLSSDTDSDSKTEIVWFEIDPNSTDSAVAGTQTSPTTVQSGTIDGTTSADWVYMPSIAVNSSGDAMICYSESNASTAVSMRAAARFTSDPSGTFQAGVTIATGAGEYDDFFADSTERWGDYSACVLDPDDDETFWVFNEICETAATASGDDADWGTRIAKMGSVVAVPVELSGFSID